MFLRAAGTCTQCIPLLKPASMQLQIHAAATNKGTDAGTQLRTSISKAADDADYHKQPVQCVSTPTYDSRRPRELHAAVKQVNTMLAKVESVPDKHYACLFFGR